MKCPKCSIVIRRVRVYSECWQWGTLKGDTIEDYGPIEDITETTGMECPECNEDIQDLINP